MLSYDQLSAPERMLWDAFPEGRWADLRTGTPDEDDPAQGGSWGRERTVRAEVVVALLLGANTRQEAAVATLRLAGARITGRLELDDAEIGHALWLDGCHVEDEISMTGTTIRTLCVRYSHLRRFDARLARVNGRFLIEHSHVDGQLSLIDARVEGSLHQAGPLSRCPGTGPCSQAGSR
ncbi:MULTISPECIES: hypothetical protein [Streptomyces]|uniref:hypothetical protein n=1 Tax=Streptomyces TaxID=1883 RepID=UPI001F0C490E|nr:MULTISPECIES: hypothetical protein [Streptomyces]